MPTDDVIRRVIKVTARVLGLDEGTIAPASNFVFDLGAESIQSLELVAGFEDEFGLELDQEAAVAVQTVESAAQFIEQQLNRTQPA